MVLLVFWFGKFFDDSSLEVRSIHVLIDVYVEHDLIRRKYGLNGRNRKDLAQILVSRNHAIRFLSNFEINGLLLEIRKKIVIDRGKEVDPWGLPTQTENFS